MANFMEKSNNVITKSGIPVARVVPLENDSAQESSSSFFVCMRGTAKIKGNIISFSSELDWEVVNS